MTPSSVESIIDAVASCTHLASDAEINLEANPTSVEAKQLRYFVVGYNIVASLNEPHMTCMMEILFTCLCLTMHGIMSHRVHSSKCIGRGLLQFNAL